MPAVAFADRTETFTDVDIVAEARDAEQTALAEEREAKAAVHAAWERMHDTRPRSAQHREAYEMYRRAVRRHDAAKETAEQATSARREAERRASHRILDIRRGEHEAAEQSVVDVARDFLVAVDRLEAVEADLRRSTAKGVQIPRLGPPLRVVEALKAWLEDRDRRPMPDRRARDRRGPRRQERITIS